MYGPRRTGGTGRWSCEELHELYPPPNNRGWSNKKYDVGGARSMHATEESFFQESIRFTLLTFFFLAEIFHGMLQINWSILFNLGLINIHSGGEFFGSWLGHLL